MPAPSTVILGTGSFAPSRIMTNDDLSRIVDTSDEWIRTRTGIRERRIAGPGEKASDLGVTPVGWDGAGQKITSVTQAEARAAGEVIEDDGEAFGKIVAFLEGLKVI